MSQILGFIAGFLTTIAFFPQAVKALSSRDTSGISLPMYLIFSVGVVCWLAYGILIQSLPIIVCNSITLILALIILSCKLHNKD